MSYSSMRTPEQVRIDQDVLDRVQRGIALLQRVHGSEWVDKIDLDILKLSNTKMCVLGQLYAEEAAAASNGHEVDPYFHGLEHLDLSGDTDWKLGFDTDHETYGELTQAWVEAIEEVRSR